MKLSAKDARDLSTSTLLCLHADLTFADRFARDFGQDLERTTDALKTLRAEIDRRMPQDAPAVMGIRLDAVEARSIPIEEQRKHVEAHKELEHRIEEVERFIAGITP